MKRGGSKLRSARSVGDAHEARLFVAGNNFQIDFGLMANAFDQNVAIASLARGAGGHGAIGGDVVRVHNSAEFAECIGGVAQSFAVEFSGGKNGMAEAHGGADGLHDFPVVGGADARDHQAKRVGPGVNRREMYGFAKSQRHRGASAEDGR